ncbi:MAG: nitrate reductase molybdenum cofactor assembly chaperone [Pseudogulbenkiania sp.]|nr:nitrate reductase molybdenum cofactor assembly chaperone [Pseudogulbenkiania sp.]
MNWPFLRTPEPRVFRALAALLTYPRAELIAALPEIRSEIQTSSLFRAPDRQDLNALIDDLSHGDPLALETRYVELFDQGRARSLHLFEHIYGDSRERGSALVSLQERYQAAGLVLAPGELADFLPVLLEFLSCRPIQEARETLSRCAHVLRAIGEALLHADSPYSAVFDTLLSFCGQRPLERKNGAVTAEVPIDQSWAEAPAFADMHGQSSEPPVAVVRFSQQGKER